MRGMTLWLPLLTACGDPLVNPGYRGEPLITIAGEILQEEPLGALPGEVLVSVFWGGVSDGTAPEVEQALSVHTEFPSLYQLGVFQPPSPSVLFETPFGEQRIAMGLILLYADVDADNVFTLGTDSLIGTSRASVLIWIDEFLTIAESDPNLPDEASYIVGDVDNRACNEPPAIADPLAIHLVVGTVCDELADLNCDGSRGEWGDICGGR